MNYLLYLEALVIVISSILIARVLSVLVRRRLHGELPAHTTQSISKAIYYIVIAIGLATAVGIAGIDVTSLLIAGGVVSIILGLALQSTLSNFFAGLLIAVERPFKVGDWIRYQDNVGLVTDIGIMSTTIYTWEGQFIRVPNNLVFTSLLTNFSRSIVRLVRVQFTVFQENDITKVVQSVTDKLNQQWFVLVEPKVVVFPVAFSENGVTLEARAWTSQNTWFDLFSNMPKLIDEALKEINVKYAYKKLILESQPKT